MERDPKDKPVTGIKDRVLNLEKAIVSISSSYAKLATNFDNLLVRLDADKYEQENFKQKVSITTESMAGLIRLIRDKNEFTEDNLTEAIALNQEDRLITQTQEMIDSGVLKEAELIKEKDSYMVCKEVDEEGKIISKRSQFALSIFSEELKKEFFGKKVGEEVKLKEGNIIQIIKIYDIIEPKEELVVPEELEELENELMQSNKSEEKPSNIEEPPVA